jgi:hypothetical protein
MNTAAQPIHSGLVPGPKEYPARRQHPSISRRHPRFLSGDPSIRFACKLPNVCNGRPRRFSGIAGRSALALRAATPLGVQTVAVSKSTCRLLVLRISATGLKAVIPLQPANVAEAPRQLALRYSAISFVHQLWTSDPSWLRLNERRILMHPSGWRAGGKKSVR